MIDGNFRPDKNAILDDLARMAGGAASLMAALRRQIGEEVRTRVDETAQRMDLVPREDLETLEETVAALRAEQDAMKSRIEALEKASAKPRKKTSGKSE